MRTAADEHSSFCVERFNSPAVFWEVLSFSTRAWFFAFCAGAGQEGGSPAHQAAAAADRAVAEAVARDAERAAAEARRVGFFS